MFRLRFVVLLLSALALAGNGLAAPAGKDGTKARRAAQGAKKAAAPRPAKRAKRPPAARTPLPPVSEAAPALPPRRPDTAAARKPPPSRAYAVEGDVFYLEGRRIRVDGVDARLGTPGSDHAVARLQQLLDSGELSVETLGEEEGTTRARVRVDGVDAAMLLRRGAFNADSAER